MITIDEATKELLSDDTISNNTKLAILFLSENKEMGVKELRGKMKLNQEDFIKCMNELIQKGYYLYDDKFSRIVRKLVGWDNAVDSVRYKSVEEYIGEYDYYPYFIQLAEKVGIDKRKIVLAKALCAKTIIKYTKHIPTIDALKFAEEYGNGKRTDEEFDKYRGIIWCIGNDIEKRYHRPIYKAVISVFTSGCDYPAYCVYDDFERSDNNYKERYDSRLYNPSKIETNNICREVLGAELIERLNAEMQKTDI